MKSYWEFNYGQEFDLGAAADKVHGVVTNHVLPALQKTAQGSKDLKDTIHNTRQAIKNGTGAIGDIKKAVVGGGKDEEEAEKAKEEAEKGWSTGAKVAAGVAGAAGVGGLGYMVGRN